jgi:hypothetical protein
MAGREGDRPPTAELGRRLLAYLERARYDPDLRFEAPAAHEERSTSS